ncbi:L-serine ammonia-lyase, iron-sulfur-dependent subunit beta [Cohnella sp. JJ-181]|uniref:L-serine ammonia-lyase, iron-sulfur-dependent subunit beta n=1 Tax=Cohnella rhizoplanae TaxID=2974897 RepID=UPI0022FF5AB4|nr:L-serine ammonia-lyase, iron-sulfur-dependent subunit beta [Cohnella sp. JJ-181]CAI6027803.1 L-serine dehydratase, beta chain [Cohnella sp. JJ-181]
MRFKDVFSIMGPSMIGPSSSHTAGAARLGLAARQTLGGQPDEADVIFSGSFAETYMGHGTDLAAAAGLLGCAPDDVRIRDAIALAEAAGMELRFGTELRLGGHPNTVRFALRKGDRTASLIGCSIGGGNVEIVNVDGFDIKFLADCPTLLIDHRDMAGTLAAMTVIVGRAGLNIRAMEVDRQSRSGRALTVMEMDQAVSDEVMRELGALEQVDRVRLVDLNGEERA